MMIKASTPPLMYIHTPPFDSSENIPRAGNAQTPRGWFDAAKRAGTSLVDSSRSGSDPGHVRDGRGRGLALAGSRRFEARRLGYFTPVNGAEDAGRTVVIACAGSQPDLERAVAASFELGVGHVVVDLGDAEMIDSSNLTALKHTAGRLRSRGGRLSVVAPHPGLASVLRLTLLSRSFTVFGTLDAALDTTA